MWWHLLRIWVLSKAILVDLHWQMLLLLMLIDVLGSTALLRLQPQNLWVEELLLSCLSLIGALPIERCRTFLLQHLLCQLKFILCYFQMVSSSQQVLQVDVVANVAKVQVSKVVHLISHLVAEALCELVVLVHL